MPKNYKLMTINILRCTNVSKKVAKNEIFIRAKNSLLSCVYILPTELFRRTETIPNHQLVRAIVIGK
jgi:hypothetical protein